MRGCYWVFRNRRKWRQDFCRKHGKHRCALPHGHRWEHQCACGAVARVRKWTFEREPSA